MHHTCSCWFWWWWVSDELDEVCWPAPCVRMEHGVMALSSSLSLFLRSCAQWGYHLSLTCHLPLQHKFQSFRAIITSAYIRNRRYRLVNEMSALLMGHFIEITRRSLRWSYHYEMARYIWMGSIELLNIDLCRCFLLTKWIALRYMMSKHLTVHSARVSCRTLFCII